MEKEAALEANPGSFSRSEHFQRLSAILIQLDKVTSAP